jgi:hypothetical protein
LTWLHFFWSYLDDAAYSCRVEICGPLSSDAASINLYVFQPTTLYSSHLHGG